jgi:hypothetical protein
MAIHCRAAKNSLRGTPLCVYSEGEGETHREMPLCWPSKQRHVMMLLDTERRKKEREEWNTVCCQCLLTNLSCLSIGDTNMWAL